MSLPGDASDVVALERAAFAAWPASEVDELDGWRLRAMHGVTRRANSVWAVEGRPDGEVEPRTDEVERWYAARGLPSQFQVCRVSVPGDLDERLARRGYLIDAPVAIMTAPVALVRERARAGDAVVDPAATEPWLAVSARRGRFRAVEGVYRGLLGRLSRAGFARVALGAEPVAAGLGVPAGDLYGVFAMSTLEAHRRRGHALALLAALAEHAGREGATTLYLQVERDNAAARALYEKTGFSERYGYHYRVRRT